MFRAGSRCSIYAPIELPIGGSALTGDDRSRRAGAPPLPARVCVAIGFTSRGAKGKTIGECWDNRCSGAGNSPLCPVEDHGPMRHDTLDDDDEAESY